LKTIEKKGRQGRQIYVGLPYGGYGGYGYGGGYGGGYVLDYGGYYGGYGYDYGGYYY
jgi:hypothetical protein